MENEGKKKDLIAGEDLRNKSRFLVAHKMSVAKLVARRLVGLILETNTESGCSALYCCSCRAI